MDSEFNRNPLSKAFEEVEKAWHFAVKLIPGPPEEYDVSRSNIVLSVVQHLHNQEFEQRNDYEKHHLNGVRKRDEVFFEMRKEEIERDKERHKIWVNEKNAQFREWLDERERKLEGKKKPKANPVKVDPPSDLSSKFLDLETVFKVIDTHSIPGYVKADMRANLLVSYEEQEERLGNETES